MDEYYIYLDGFSADNPENPLCLLIDLLRFIVTFDWHFSGFIVAIIQVLITFCNLRFLERVDDRKQSIYIQMLVILNA
jgi:hypothetical protein